MRRWGSTIRSEVAGIEPATRWDIVVDSVYGRAYWGTEPDVMYLLELAHRFLQVRSDRVVVLVKRSDAEGDVRWSCFGQSLL